MGGGCGFGLNSAGGKKQGGFYGGSPRDFLGQFSAGSEDPGEEDSGGEEVGRGDLFFPSAAGCASGDGEFDRLGPGVGVGAGEAEAFWESDGEGDWVEGNKREVEEKWVGEKV